MSARMATVTGNKEWEVRYRRFEPELAGTIAEILTLAPDSSAAEVIASTDAANSALVKMENRAFELTHQNRLEEAQATLIGAEYERQKRIYSAGMVELDSVLKQSVRQAVKDEYQRVRIVLMISTVALPLLFISWIVTLRTINRWKAALTRQSAELAQLNSGLNRKVAERTSELECSREDGASGPRHGQ